jgi:Ni,Fe-hydrogenase III large subunit
MLRVVLFLVAIILGMVLVAMTMGWRYAGRLIQNKNTLTKERLLQHQKRLSQVVEQLLIAADDIDHGSKYTQTETQGPWSAELGRICSELVQLSQTIELIRHKLEANQLMGMKEQIWRSCLIAETLANRLRNTRAHFFIEKK